MRFVIQVVSHAEVEVAGETVGRIGKGFAVLIGVGQEDTKEIADNGNRPGFTYAGEPKMAEEMYEYIIRKVKEQIPVVQKGIFGADMKLSLTNEGPFTILLDSDELFRL